MWTARRGVDTREREVGFAESRNAGLQNLEQIAHDEAAHVRLSPATCLSYLKDNLHFFLGARERLGLYTFHKHAAELKLAPAEWNLEHQELRGKSICA